MTGELLVKLDKRGLPQFWQYLTSNEMLFIFQISTSHMMIWQRITKMMKTLPWPALWNQRWVLWIPFLLLGTLSVEATLPLSYLPPVSLAVVTKLVSLWKRMVQKYGFNTRKWLSTDIGKYIWSCGQVRLCKITLGVKTWIRLIHQKPPPPRHRPKDQSDLILHC